MLNGKRILLIISGGIAAYKSLELIRRLRERGAEVRCVLTAGGAHFVTPLSLAALSEDKVYTDIFSLTDESEMGHIRLSREADLLVVAPATRGHPGQDGGRPRRRSRHHGAARDRQAGHGRAGDECPDVGACGDARQHRDAGKARRAPRRTGRRRHGLRRVWRGTLGRGAGHRRRDHAILRDAEPQTVRWPAAARW